MNSWIYLDEKIGFINSTHGFPFGFHIKRYICFSELFFASICWTKFEYINVYDYHSWFMNVKRNITSYFDQWFLDVLNGSHDTSLNWYTWGHKNIWCNYVTKAIRALFQPFSHIYILLCKGWGIQLANHCECIELYSV
jgi:hypothetical protein